MGHSHSSHTFAALYAWVYLLGTIFDVVEDDVVAGGVHNLHVINEVNVVSDVRLKAGDELGG